MKCPPAIFRTILYMLSVSMLLTSQGCSSTRIVTIYDSNTIANNPLNKKTTWTYAWGLIQPKDINPGCDINFVHMNSVTVKTNLGYILLSTITLGIVIPQRVEWTCAPAEIKPETLGKP
jgi:hypothetical protein